MLSVLIVEDEILVSIGLKNMINWSSMGMRVISEARNGEDAFSIYQNEKPDIILTDIRMPVMDGLELIAKIRETDAKTKIIILTCYQEFDLVHKALKLGVSDYILKLKMSTEEMEAVILKVRNEIESDNMNRVLCRYSETDIQLAKANLILDYVSLQSFSENGFADIVNQLHLRLYPGRLVLCLLCINASGEMHGRFDSEQERVFRDTALNILMELVRLHAIGEVLHEHDGRYLLILCLHELESEEAAREKLFGFLMLITDNIKAYMNATVCFGVSSFQERFSALKSLYDEAIVSLEQNYFAACGEFRQYGEHDKLGRGLEALNGLRSRIHSLHGMNADYRKEVLAGIDQLSKLPDATKERIQEMFVRWIHFPTVVPYAYGYACEATAIDYAGRVRASSALGRTIEIFEQYLRSLFDSGEAAKGVSREISSAVKYIHEHYAENLSLRRVADSIQISANYLSSLFRKELQICFVDYVNRVRIGKAKELLVGTHMKSYEISHRIGFSNESYFSKIFKRETGVRPNEYKRTVIP